jgi:hypothetical protein
MKSQDGRALRRFTRRSETRPRPALGYSLIASTRSSLGAGCHDEKSFWHRAGGGICLLTSPFIGLGDSCLSGCFRRPPYVVITLERATSWRSLRRSQYSARGPRDARFRGSGRPKTAIGVFRDSSPEDELVHTRAGRSGARRAPEWMVTNAAHNHYRWWVPETAGQAQGD